MWPDSRWRDRKAGAKTGDFLGKLFVAAFGQSEVERDTIVIPVTVVRYFAPVERIDPMYVQAQNAEEVPAVTQAVREILESRHSPRARYLVDIK